MPKTTNSAVSVRLDQWADGPMSEGDFNGTGKNEEVFVNGNLNAQKAHYNEGDAIPYRAIMDDLTTNVVYSITIQWDTVDSGAYALDYLTSYNFSFDGSKHPGEPDVAPTQGLTDVSHAGANPPTTTQVAIPTDTRLLTGFGTGTQYGITDGLASGQPSGQQYVTIFGSVTNAHADAAGIQYNADGTKASLKIFFTYTGVTNDNNDAVVLAWGGHIASRLDWRDDTGETVQTASDINGSPYHMRVLEISEDGVPKSIGNQDRSLSADAVNPPTPPTGTDVILVLDEDNIAGIGNNDTAPGDDAQSASLTGTITLTDATSVDFAALNNTTVKDTSGNNVTSGGATHTLTYVWDSSTSTLYARTDPADSATTIFSIDINGSGPFTYSVAMLGKIDHPDTNNVNTEDPNVLVTVPFTVTGLGGTTSANFQLTFDDDIPVRAASATPVTATVQEDGLSSTDNPESGTANLGGADQSDGNPESGESNTSDQASGAAGSLSSLVSVGADSPGKFDLNSDTSSLATLWSQGTALKYVVSDTDADGFNDQLVATAGTRTVFTLTVATDGGWKFDLDDQMDHVDDGKNDENTALRAGATGTDSASGIDFSTVLRVTDSDNDTVSPLIAGDFAITVKDDIPIRAASPTPVTATVQEDGLSSTNNPESGTANLDGIDLSNGNPESGESNTSDQASGATGSLASLVSVGADDPAKFDLSDDTSSLATLWSQGTALKYAVTDTNADGFNDQLVATAGTRTVFTLTVATDGGWKFDLDDQMDHVDDGKNDENTALRSGATGTAAVNTIDFATILRATDSDGDTLTPFQAGDFAMTVKDDIPVRAASPAPVTATVQEDGLSSTNNPESGAANLDGIDLSDGNPESGESNTSDQASGATGSLSSLVSVGADDPAKFDLKSDTSSLATLWSQGVALKYAVSDTDADGFNDQLVATAGTRTVFTLTVATDGGWKFDLDDQMDHVDDGKNDENTALRAGATGTNSASSIDFSSILQATDSDGDTVSPLNAGDFAITVKDDIPVRGASASPVTATVQEDGLSTKDNPESGTANLNGIDLSDGNAESGETNTSDQASGAAGSLSSLASVGADDPGKFDLDSDTSKLATLWSQGVALKYAVTDTDADGFNDKLVATADARTVFTLTVGTDGAWKFDLDDQMDHVNDGKNDENTALRAGSTGTASASGIDFSSVLRVTDSDGDSTSPFLAGDFAITVKDDIPVGFTPDTVTLTNTGTDVKTAALNSGGKVGADEAPAIVFVDDDTTDALLRSTSGTVLTSNKLDISLSGFGTGKLTASTTEGTVFTASLNTTTNEYTIDFDRVIDDGKGINFLGAAPVKSGNPTYNVINNVDGTTLDLLFSGGDTEGGAPTSHSVNVSTQGAGTDNQSMNATGTGTSAIGDLLRIDFMVGAALSGSPNGSSFTPGTYQNVNGYSFLVSQNNPGGTTATAFVQCVDANADSQLISNLDQVDPITKVTVNGQILLDAGTFHNLTINGKSVTGSMLNGGVVIQGLNEGTTGDGAGGDDPVVKVWTGTGFNRVEVSNYAGQPISGSQNYGGNDFDIAPAGVDQAVQGTQFNFNLFTQMTDFDGDKGPVETIGVTVNPLAV